MIRRIQMIFQDPAASLNERATVDYIISEGLYNHRLFKDEEERKEKVKNIIREVGLLAIYKGVIVEVAETEELFNNPIHPYTQALLSAVPIPDPILERKKVLKVYDPSQHDYETDKPSMVEIRPDHYVWANQAELKRKKKGLN